jgi:hypothetical protein
MPEYPRNVLQGFFLVIIKVLPAKTVEQGKNTQNRAEKNVFKCVENPLYSSDVFRIKIVGIAFQI